MKQCQSLTEFLYEKYKPNEPIFLSDICMNYNDPELRKVFSRLVNKGVLIRYDDGIYYIPKKNKLGLITGPLPEDVIKEKYLKQDNDICGYFSGPLLYNGYGLTSQVPFRYDVVTNKATNDYRETKLRDIKVVIKKPRTTVTKNNYKILQFLDVMTDVDKFSELEGKELKNALKIVIDKNKLTYKNVSPYFNFYPTKLYKNLIETGVVCKDGILI